MTDDERALSIALHDVAGRGPAGSPPVDELLSRGRRRRRTRSAFACACALGVTGAGTLAALVAVGPGTGPSPETASTAPGPGRPGPIALSLAAERTHAAPFRFSLTSKVPRRGGKPGGQPRTGTSEGAFDPSAMRGYTKSVAGGQIAESIRIGDTCYSQPALGAPWSQLTCSPSTDGISLEGLTQDPAAILEQLEAAGEATHTGRTGSGSGEVDDWKFTFTVNPQDPAGAGPNLVGYTVAGTAAVGVADRHVAAVDFTIAVAPNAMNAVGVTDVSITFSDYGAPVNVTAPTRSTQ